ncbi:hypothetical protein CWI38_0341p0020 [Hamiltosporidium tvaerminnensis]|uniref:Uncharacterized protein n=1 Tax=Hamiltosporidium tvaerminnensis TaxID=1176355 RepID=A0A4Q9M112_9MICR|nr:hypothetical protein CWI38_0341p0020 [Hamiltosporidium tvaerminnensis]
MNICALPTTKKNSYYIFFSNCIRIVSTLLIFRLIISERCRYYFSTNENSEILFFREENSTIDIVDHEFNLILFSNFNSRSLNKKNLVFRYKKGNFLQFEVLKNLLLPNNIKNNNGTIECGFELSYFLKISSDLEELPNKPNSDLFKCMFLTFKFLKVIENKQLLKFLQALILLISIFDKNKTSNFDFNIKELFNSGFLTELDSYIKKNFIFAILNVFMMKYIFYDENLILLENINNPNDVSFFNEHIPYKSLLINNYNIFCRLENILRNPNISFSFLYLLNEINIKSLIINNNRGFIIPDSEFYFSSFSHNIFKSITISNFNDSSSSFLLRFNAFIGNNIEYLTLKNILVARNILNLLLNKLNLRGLVLYDVNITGFPICIDDFTYSIKTLDYVDFSFVDISNTWWNDFFRRVNVSTLILFFRSKHAEENFINEFMKIDSMINISYFSMQFYFRKIHPGFVRALSHLQYLKTLKLKGYLAFENVETNLYKAVEDMKELEYLEMCQVNYNIKSLDLMLQAFKIKVLHLENIVLGKETLNLNFFCNHKSITKLVLRKIKICAFFLKEIFKLENLKTLIIQFCVFEPILDSESLIFLSNNIYILDLYGTNLELIKDYDILGKLDNLEYLYLSFCKIFPEYLSNLSVLCNSRLRMLNFEHGALYPSDLNRIQELEILEELNLFCCSFINCSFGKLGNNCKFFKSLVNLNLSFVDLTIEDFIYCKNFKSLKKLSIELPAFNLIAIRKCLLCLPLEELATNYIAANDKFKNFCHYFYERGIDVS